MIGREEVEGEGAGKEFLGTLGTGGTTGERTATGNMRRGIGFVSGLGGETTTGRPLSAASRVLLMTAHTATTSVQI